MNETTRAALENQVMEVLKGLDDGELVSVWNEYCYANNMYDDEVFGMDRFSEFYESYDAEEVARRCFYGHDEYGEETSFNPNRDYFYLNGYGNPVSFDFVGYNEFKDEFMCPVFDMDAVVDYVLDNMDGLECDEITEILEDYENGIE